MQRIGKQQEAIDEIWLSGAEHAGLTSAVRVSTQENPPSYEPTHGIDSVLQTFTIADCITGARGPIGARLPVWQITAQNCKSSG